MVFERREARRLLAEPRELRPREPDPRALAVREGQGRRDRRQAKGHGGAARRVARPRGRLQGHDRAHRREPAARAHLPLTAGGAPALARGSAQQPPVEHLGEQLARAGRREPPSRVRSQNWSWTPLGSVSMRISTGVRARNERRSSMRAEEAQVVGPAHLEEERAAVDVALREGVLREHDRRVGSACARGPAARGSRAAPGPCSVARAGSRSERASRSTGRCSSLAHREAAPDAEARAGEAAAERVGPAPAEVAPEQRAGGGRGDAPHLEAALAVARQRRPPQSTGTCSVVRTHMPHPPLGPRAPHPSIPESPSGVPASRDCNPRASSCGASRGLRAAPPCRPRRAPAPRRPAGEAPLPRPCGQRRAGLRPGAEPRQLGEVRLRRRARAGRPPSARRAAARR